MIKKEGKHMKHILYTSGICVGLILLYLCSFIRIEYGVATSPYEYATRDGHRWGVDAPYQKAVIIFNDKGTRMVQDDDVLCLIKYHEEDR